MKTIIKHKSLYYLLNFTWGLLLTIVGMFVALYMLITLHKPHNYKGALIFYTKKPTNYGFSIGITIVVGQENEGLKSHELGHTYQNAILGLLMPFLVSIPSVIRYWVREIQYKNGKELKPYDSIWFEGQATNIGKMVLVEEKEKCKD